MSNSIAFDKVISTKIVPVQTSINPEVELIEAKERGDMKRNKGTNDLEEDSPGHNDHEYSKLWDKTIPSPLVRSDVIKEVKVKNKLEFNIFLKYFSLNERTKDLNGASKICFSLLYVIIIIVVYGGFFCSHLASLFLLINQNNFSSAVIISHTALEAFVPSQEIRMSRDDCPSVSSNDIRIFLTMHEEFPKAIAIASFVILLLSILLVRMLSKMLSVRKTITALMEIIIAGSILGYCTCKIVLIVVLFYNPMYAFTILNQNFMILDSSQCFSTNSGGVIAKSLIDSEEQFNVMKVWMGVELGSICSIMVFPCIMCGNIVSRMKNNKKDL